MTHFPTSFSVWPSLWPVCAHCHWAGAGKVSGWGWWPHCSLLSFNTSIMIRIRFHNGGHHRCHHTKSWIICPRCSAIWALMNHPPPSWCSFHPISHLRIYFAHLRGRKETYLLQESVRPSGLLAGRTLLLLHCTVGSTEGSVGASIPSVNRVIHLYKFLSMTFQFHNWLDTKINLGRNKYMNRSEYANLLKPG